MKETARFFRDTFMLALVLGATILLTLAATGSLETFLRY